MRYLAGTLSILTLLVTADLASAQARTGRATGSTSGRATGSTSGSVRGSATGIGARTSGRSAPAPRTQVTGVIRGRSDAVDRTRSVPVRSPRSGSIGGTSTGGRTVTNVGGTSTGGRTVTNIGGGGTIVTVRDDRLGGRTAVRRDESRAGSASGGAIPGGIGDLRGGGERITGGGGGIIRGGDGVIRGSADGVIRGSGVGSRYGRSGWGVRSGPYYADLSYGRHVVFDPWYRARFRHCPVSFVFGRHGLTCFHAFGGARFLLPVPFFFIYPLAVVHLQSTTTYGATTVVPSGYRVETESPGCAVVTVVLPGNDGYWKTLRLPVENAYTRDDLRRLISDRLRAGATFTLQDADGVRLEIPAGLQINEILVEPCR